MTDQLKCPCGRRHRGGTRGKSTLEGTREQFRLAQLNLDGAIAAVERVRVAVGGLTQAFEARPPAEQARIRNMRIRNTRVGWGFW